MSTTKKIMIGIIALALACVIVVFIALSPWIILAVGLLLSPAPPKPEIKYGEFDFKFVYEIDGEIHTIEDTIICEFDGFNIDEGNGKTRRWKEEFKNEQGNELYAFRVEQINNPEFHGYNSGRKPVYDKIVLKNTDQYKVLLSVADAEYCLGEPNDKTSGPIEPTIRIYDKTTCYYKDFEESEKILKSHDFKVISWECDEPIENTFKQLSITKNCNRFRLQFLLFVIFPKIYL